MISEAIIGAFSMFKRPMSYVREKQEIPISGFVTEASADLTLAGDMGQTPSLVTLTVEDMLQAGVFPPQKYDRIIYNGVSHAVQDHRINFDGEQAVLVRLRVAG